MASASTYSSIQSNLSYAISSSARSTKKTSYYSTSYYWLTNAKSLYSTSSKSSYTRTNANTSIIYNTRSVQAYACTTTVVNMVYSYSKLISFSEMTLQTTMYGNATRYTNRTVRTYTHAYSENSGTTYYTYQYSGSWNMNNAGETRVTTTSNNKFIRSSYSTYHTFSTGSTCATSFFENLSFISYSTTTASSSTHVWNNGSFHYFWRILSEKTNYYF